MPVPDLSSTINPVMNDTYKDADEAWEAGQEWIERSNKWEKMEYLKETCSNEFYQECTLLDEMVRWMDEDDFSRFFEKVCRDWDIKTPQELEYSMHS